jgi:nitrogen fixation NifU-like protein
VRVELAPAAPGAEPVVERISWEGQGCSISMAAASVLAETAPGLTRPEVEELIEAFRVLLRSRGSVAPDEEVLGDAAAFAGVSRFVARVKCAMLGWVAAEEALARAD